jgi:hypothetical protein
VYEGVKLLGEEKLKELKDEPSAEGAKGRNCVRRSRGRGGAVAGAQGASLYSLIQCM